MTYKTNGNRNTTQAPYSDVDMNVEEFKTMLLDYIRSSESSMEFDNWVGNCLLRSYEDSDIDNVVFEEIEHLEKGLLDNHAPAENQ